MTKSLSFVLLVLLLVSCKDAQPSLQELKEKTFPSWYVNPPSNSQVYLYGTGEGKTLKQAQKNALDSMISQLGVSISSTYASKLQVHKKRYGEFFTKDTQIVVNSEVAKIRISNYEIVEQVQYKYNSIMVLLRSNKQDFSTLLIKELTRKLDMIEDEREHVKDSDALQRYAFYERSSTLLETMFSTILVLNSLHIPYDEKRYLSLVEEVGISFQSLKSSMTFSFHAKGIADGFKEQLQVSLSEDGKHVISLSLKKKNHININIMAKSNYARSHGFNIARVIISIEVKDYKEKIISINKLDVVGHATQGRDVALNEAVKSLKKKIASEGILKVIGLNL